MTTQELQKALYEQIPKIPQYRLEEALDLLQNLSEETTNDWDIPNNLDMDKWIKELREIIGEDTIDFSKRAPAKRDEIYEELL